MAAKKTDHCPLSCVNPVLFSLPLSLFKNEQLYIATGQVLSDRQSKEPVSGGERANDRNGRREAAAVKGEAATALIAWEPRLSNLAK